MFVLLFFYSAYSFSSSKHLSHQFPPVQYFTPLGKRSSAMQLERLAPSQLKPFDKIRASTITPWTPLRAAFRNSVLTVPSLSGRTCASVPVTHDGKRQRNSAWKPCLCSRSIPSPPNGLLHSISLTTKLPHWRCGKTRRWLNCLKS